MTIATLDLSPRKLIELCKGNVNNLPSFVVHDNLFWRDDLILPDADGRIHLSQRTFQRSVVTQVPVRQGLWVGTGAQQYYIDLQPHHLQGSKGMAAGEVTSEVARAVAKIDKHGRAQSDDGYGEDT